MGLYIGIDNAELHYNHSWRLKMATLTVTSRGQVTLRKEFLEHIGVKPGDQIDLKKTPNGKLMLERARPKGSWDDFFGCLKGKTNVRLSIEEINDAIAEAGAEAGMAGLKR
jgi:AbrB family looped-hinge helix DNA binding protein